MIVSRLPFYSSIPDCHCVLGLYSSSFPHVIHIYFLLIPRPTSRFQATQLVVSGCQRCRNRTFPSGFQFPPHLATPEADVGPFWPQAPRCATRGCNSTFTPRGKDLSSIFLCLYPALLFYPYIAIIFFFFFLSFQSSRTLELALHLESKVIALKQDAL